MNGADYLKHRIRHLSQEIAALARTAEFDAEDPWRFVRDAAALLERFLQGCTLRYPPADSKLYNLIEALAHEGVSPAVRDDLHAVRRAANAGKHDANRDLTTIEAARLLAAAESAIAALASSGIPEFSAAYRAKYRRQYLIAVYYHYTGESEFAVFLAAHKPRPTDAIGYGPPIIELFQCDIAADAAIRTSLAELGRAVFDGGVDPAILEALRRDSEFAFAWLWEGGHQDLVAAFAPHQHSMDLIPGLLRGDHGQSVLSSMVSAAVEMARPFDWADLLLKTDADYGVSRRGTLARPIAESVAELVGKVPDSVVLGGPRWLDRDSYALLTQDTLAEDRRLGVAVLQDGTLAVALETHGRGAVIRVLEDEDLIRPDDPLPPGI